MVQTLQEPAQEITRLRMSWEDYLRLPEKPKAEYADGEVLLMSPARRTHGAAVRELLLLFHHALPNLPQYTHVGLHLPGNRLRVPDLMLVESTSRDDSTWVTDPPVLVVEVLSTATRAEDTGPKMDEYAAGGVGQYWIADPDNRTIDVLRNNHGHWTQILHLDDSTPVGTVTVSTATVGTVTVGTVTVGPINPGKGGTVTVDLNTILGNPR
jgi:Uma2 family endonuclease